jgi:hypothetical protein
MASATKPKPRSPAKKPKAAAKRSAKARPTGKPPAAKSAAGKAPATKPSATAEFPGLESPERSAPPLAEVDADVLEFIEALDRFKKQHGRPFPSWSEVLLVVRQLGYTRQ